MAPPFLTFSDYCRPSIRLASLMRRRAVFVMTHDSIGLGEDGPTHQPVEHLSALRAIPTATSSAPATRWRRRVLAAGAGAAGGPSSSGADPPGPPHPAQGRRAGESLRPRGLCPARWSAPGSGDVASPPDGGRIAVAAREAWRPTARNKSRVGAIIERFLAQDDGYRADGAGRRHGPLGGSKGGGCAGAGTP